MRRGALAGVSVTELASDDDGHFEGNFRIDWELNEGRTYYVEVRGAGNATGRYVLEAYVTYEVDEPGEDDHGDTLDSATIVGVQSSTGGALEQGGDRDFFRIDSDTEGKTLRVETTGPTDTFGTLYDSAGVVLASDDNGSFEENFRIDWELNEGRTYYVEVRGQDETTTAAAMC